MKRFNIHNKASGLRFQVERDNLGPLQPEWGKPKHTVREAILDAEGKPVLGKDGNPQLVERTVPAEFEIIETDITAELAQQAAKQAALDRVLNTDWDKVNTVAELKAVLRQYIERNR